MYKTITLFSVPVMNIENKWKKFVEDHANGNFFQTFTYFKFLLNQKNLKPFAIIAWNSDDDICGLLVGSIQNFGPKYLNSFLSRIVIYGGPLLKSIEYANLIDCIFNELISMKSVYVEFRNLFNVEKLKPFLKKSGFQYQEHLNFIVKIDDFTLKKIKEDKSRQIKKALKNGAIIEEAVKLEQINELYSILKFLYKTKVKKPLPPLEHFQKIFLSKDSEHPSKIFLVLYEQKVIGGIFSFTYKNEVIYEYYICGLDSKYKELYPSVLATYAPIKYAVENDYKYFDFLGAGKPTQDYGVRKFKSRFGGDEISYGRFMKINSPLFYLYKFILNFYAKKNKS